MRFFNVLICLIIFWFSSVSADYVRNIDDEIKINAFTAKLEKYLKKSKNWAELKLKYQKIISEKLWKNHDELKRFWPNWGDEYQSFKEYFLMNIYLVFTRFNYTGVYSINQYSDFKVLENDYIRTIARSNDLFIDNKSVYFKWYSWNKNSLLYFFQINQEESLKNYIEDNLMEEEFQWTCEVIQKDTSKWSSSDNKIFFIQYTDEYQKSLEDNSNYKENNNWELLKWPKCGKYWYADIYRKTDTLVFYHPHPIEYLGEDFSLIELKD